MWGGQVRFRVFRSVKESCYFDTDAEVFRLPPNGTLCLNRWGLKTLLDRYSQKFMKYSFAHSKNSYRFTLGEHPFLTSFVLSR